MVIVAGAPYNGLAKEREGAPSFFPHCSCPFYNILPSFFVAALSVILLKIFFECSDFRYMLLPRYQFYSNVIDVAEFDNS